MERGLDGFYVAECPVLEGAYSQGKTIDEALVNIRAVIGMILEEKPAQKYIANYSPEEFSLHTLKV